VSDNHAQKDCGRTREVLRDLLRLIEGAPFNTRALFLVLPRSLRFSWLLPCSSCRRPAVSFGICPPSSLTLLGTHPLCQTAPLACSTKWPVTPATRALYAVISPPCVPSPHFVLPVTPLFFTTGSLCAAAHLL